MTPYDGVAFRRVTVACSTDRPTNRWFVAPDFWSLDAADLIATRCAAQNVAAALRPVPEDDVPEFLWRHEPDDDALADLPDDRRLVGEQDVRAVIDRIAGGWSYWGWKGGYFDSEADARAFNDECRFLVCHQFAVPELALLRRVGLHWAYGLDGSAPDCFLADFRTGFVRRGGSDSIAPSGAVINGVTGDTAGDTGVWALRRAEAKLAALGCPSGIDASAVKAGDTATLLDGATPCPVARRRTLSPRHQAAAEFAARNIRAQMNEAVATVGRDITERHVRNVADAAKTDRNGAAARFAIAAARQAALPASLLDQIAALSGSC